MAGMFSFPRITPEMIEQAGCKASAYSFGYRTVEGSMVTLRSTATKSSIGIADEVGVWNITNDGLTVTKEVTVTYPDALYGPSGVVPSGGAYGICIVWTNAKLSQTGVILPTRVDRDGDDTFSFRHTFEPGTISGNVVLDLSVYVQRAAKQITADEAHLVNEAGVFLGNLEDPITLLLESQYEDFPIGEMEEEGGPLWRIDFFDWEDPRVDRFSEDSFILLLNTKHPDCPTITDKGVSNQNLLNEIIAAAYFLIFEKVRSFEGGAYWDDMQSNSNLEKNSICSVLHWFSKQNGDQAFHWNSPEDLMDSIKRIVDLNFRESDK